jgi:hypothetical protein
MKTYLKILVLLISIQSLSAQTEIEIRTLSSGEILEYGETYIFKINDINLNIYKVESTINQESFNIQVPSVFKGIKLPSYLNIELPEAAEKIDDIDKNGGVNTLKDPTLDDHVVNINGYLKIINESNNEIVKTAVVDNEITNLLNSCDQTYSQIEKALIAFVKNTSLSTSGSTSQQVSDIESHLNTAIANAIDAEKNLLKEAQRQKVYINSLIESNAAIIFKWEVDLLPETDSNYKKAFKIYKIAFRNNAEYAKGLKKLEEVIAAAKAVTTEIKKFRDENKVQLLVDKYNMINVSNFTYRSKPIKVESDEVKLEFIITSEKRLPCDKLLPEIKKYTLKVKGKTKIDFSTGAFFNSGNDDFLGRDLYYSSISETESVIRAKDGGSRGLLSIGGLMHIYKRSDKNMHLALSPGVSVSSGFDQVNFHLGGSVLFGNKNRLVITGGITLRETKILDRNFELDTAYAKTDLPETPPVISVFPKAGLFFSLTYNFSKFESASE